MSDNPYSSPATDPNILKRRAGQFWAGICLLMLSAGGMGYAVWSMAASFRMLAQPTLGTTPPKPATIAGWFTTAQTIGTVAGLLFPVGLCLVIYSFRSSSSGR